MEHHLIWTALVGLVTGWLASILVQGKGMGVLPDMVVGILGALIGGFLANTLHIHIAEGLLGNLAISILGAVVLLVVIRLLRPSR